MDALSETESEPEQFPTEPVVEETSLEKPKRKYVKKVKIVEPAAEPAAEPATEPAKPKRVMTEEHKEKMRLAREASKARKALTKPEPITQETEVLPEPKKRGRPKKVKEDKVEPKAEPKEKVIVKEIHHHYSEPKKEKAKKEAAPRKPRQPKVEQAKPKTVVVDFV